jgi:hypothetical protein
MKKLLIASAVSAAFAAPTTALAQAARVPTLGQVLEASGVSLNGYIDAAYSWANKNVETGFSNRVFDSQNNSFALRQVGLMVSKQPKEGFGGVVNVTIGSDAQFIHSFPETGGPGASTFDITQGYGQYATGSLTLMAGKFVTLSGTEVIWSPSNTTFSRSMLFGSVPFTHTGVRASYALGDQLTLYGGINNGWDQLTDGNRGKTVELGAAYTPIKPLSLYFSGYSGKESAGGVTGTGPQDTRNSFDFVATWSITNAMSLGGEILYVAQDRPTGGAAKVNGAAVYFTYLFTPQWRIVTRGELFDDKQNFRGAPGVTAGSGVKYTELTVAGSYMPNSSIELRAEVRGDRADEAVFIDSDGSTGKSLQSVALQGIYKF